MSRYRRVKIRGGTFFFTLALADRSSDLPVCHGECLWRVFAAAQNRSPFETAAICILPDHIHALWQLPDGDADYASRRSLFQPAFSRRLPPAPTRSVSKVARRQKGIRQRRYWEHTIRDDADLARSALAHPALLQRIPAVWPRIVSSIERGEKIVEAR